MRILTINSGSSSIKFSLYDMGDGEVLVLSGKAEGIGVTEGRFRTVVSAGGVASEEHRVFRSHVEALEAITAWLGGMKGAAPDAVGHRLVHGGCTYIKPHRINAELLDALDALVPFAPDHLPHEIGAIKAFERFYPRIAQVACFDTAFHRTMPDVAQRYALPADVRSQGIVRY